MSKSIHYDVIKTNINFKVDPVRLKSDLDAFGLVQSRISQTDFYFCLYPSDLRFKVIKTTFKAPTDSSRGKITGFSRGSQRRLGFTARNSASILTSQFCMTYHNTIPDGETSKKHINTFLTYLRKIYPPILYLWVMEFQDRGTVHYHLFSNLPVTPYFRRTLAIAWNRITQESKEHLQFHKFHKNFIKWDMRNGSYLTKYLVKMEQKGVPESFSKCGRFWGSSRGLVPKPYVITMDEVMAYIPSSVSMSRENIQKYIRRTLLKCYETALSRMKKYSVNKRKYYNNYLIPFGNKLFYQILDYFSATFHRPDLLAEKLLPF